MSKISDRQKVVVVGAGPVGAMAGLYAASRGDDVEIYDLRGDLRDSSTAPLNFTKSINLALSERGINAMRHSGNGNLLGSVLEETIPMHGRMIHGRKKTGELYQESQAYDVHGRFLRAVDRARLNKRLLDALEQLPNVKLCFNHKLTGVDFKNNLAWFEQLTPSKKDDSTQDSMTSSPDNPGVSRPLEIERSFELLLGADGAHSSVRHHMMKYTRLNYTQSYIDTLWCEFQIQPTASSTFVISPNHLHIWPARVSTSDRSQSTSMMFIAIPSMDHSFTCTLFAPSHVFTELSSSPSSLPNFFNSHFPGVCPDLIPTSDLISQFTNSPHLPLISIICSPHHVYSSACILGDAAHAMVPFYGQGMNAGLEDVRVLFQFLDWKNVYSPRVYSSPQERTARRGAALEAYTEQRCADAASINRLALKNYEEMSQSVINPLYKVRKLLEEKFNVWAPWSGFRTQYSRISFGNDRYSVVEREVARQGKLLMALILLGLMGWGGLGIAVLRKWMRTKDGMRKLLRDWLQRLGVSSR